MYARKIDAHNSPYLSPCETINMRHRNLSLEIYVSHFSAIATNLWQLRGGRLTMCANRHAMWTTGKQMQTFDNMWQIHPFTFIKWNIGWLEMGFCLIFCPYNAILLQTTGIWVTSILGIHIRNVICSISFPKWPSVALSFWIISVADPGWYGVCSGENQLPPINSVSDSCPYHHENSTFNIFQYQM